MGLIRMGDPIKYPDTDIKITKGIKYILDSVWREYREAARRENQLERDGKTVYVSGRQAPPEEVMGHFHTRGIVELGEKPIHIDGRWTDVWDVWVAQRRLYRVKKSVKPKVKSKRPVDDITKGILDVTKVGVVGIMGMGLLGAMGGMLRKSKKIRPKAKKCRCK